MLRQDLELYHRAQTVLVKDRQRYARRVGKEIPPDYVPRDTTLSQEMRAKLRADHEKFSLRQRQHSATFAKKRREKEKGKGKENEKERGRGKKRSRKEMEGEGEEEV